MFNLKVEGKYDIILSYSGLILLILLHTKLF